MKAKLIKLNDYYYLRESYKSDNDGSQCERTLGTTNSQGELGKLSKQNCDEIFGVTDVEKLADEAFPDESEPGWRDSFSPRERKGFKSGFNKAMELNKDKVFTLKDVKQAIFNFANYDRKTISELDRMDMAITSIQQPTEIEVEIETETKVWEFISNGEFESFEIIPKLDSNGCIILKKL
jgi:hypothetical protein